MPQVSRLTSGGKLVIDGKPACVKCGRRPQRWSGKRWQSYCGPCHTYDQWQRRLGKTELLVRDEDRGLHVAIRGAELSEEERHYLIDQIVELRAKPSGRHHAGLSVEHLRRRQWAAWNWSLYLVLLGAVMLIGAKGY